MLKIKAKPIRQSFAKLAEQHKIAWWGSETPKIIFVVDPHVSENPITDKRPPINKRQLEFLANFLRREGIKKEMLAIVTACPQVTQEMWQSDRTMGKFITEFNDSFKQIIDAAKPKIVVAMGKTAARSVTGHAVKITNIRGLPTQSDAGHIIHPMFGLNHVISQPDVMDLFDADMATLGRMIANNYSMSDNKSKVEVQYSWCTDLSDLIKNPPKVCCLDAEWTGGEWYDNTLKVLTIQLCYEEGKAIIIPVHYDHKKGGLRDEGKYTDKIKEQLKVFLSGKTKFYGHNIKSDWHVILSEFGIRLPSFADDTILMIHAVDENMQNKGLDDAVRRWVPAMSGYADEFNRDPVHLKKTRMDLVPPDKMLMYGCGDVDAGYRLRKALRELLKADEKSYNCYKRVTLPAARALCDLERRGMPISVRHLKEFETELRAHQQEQHKKLIQSIPKHIVDRYKDKELKTPIVIRPGLLREYLFTDRKGLRIKPVVFTKSTRNKKDSSERVPSLSSKEHFPYFADKYPFVLDIMQFIKNEKLLGTYVGDEDDDSGFWKYIRSNKIYPYYLLHRTVTGRSASIKPNGQNLPKRGKFAKKYRGVFVAPKGKVFIQADYSQLELRLVAIASNDPVMLRIYREGGDIHSTTAAALSGVSLQVFQTWPEEKRELARFRAKAVNFGFCVAKGQRVLTDHGLIPIEDIKDWYKVWDGVEFVSHGGVVSRGYKRVISYDGLRATADHRVYSEGLPDPVPFGEIASSVQGRRLLISGIGEKGLRVSEANPAYPDEESQPPILRSGVLELQTGEMDINGQRFIRKEYQLHMSSEIQWRLASQDSWSEVRRHDSTLLPHDAPESRELQRSWNSGAIQITRTLHQVGLKEMANGVVQGNGLGSNEQRRSLLSEEFAACDTISQSEESETISEVFDIIDAGPRRRFTVEGKLVANCYGMGWRKFQSYAKTDYGLDLTDAQAQEYRRTYYNLYKNIAVWHERIRAFVRKHGYVRGFDGRTRHLKAIFSPDEKVQSQAERYAINSPIQGSGSDLGLMSISRINQEVEESVVMLCGFVHDALVNLAPEESVVDAARVVKHYMESNPLEEWFGVKLPIPIVADIEIGKTLAELKKCSVSILNDKKIKSYDQFIGALDNAKKAA